MKHNRKNWRFIKNHENSFNKRLTDRLRLHIKQNPSSYPLNIEEMMNLFGLKYDGEIIYNYCKVQQFLIKHRQYAMDMMEASIKNGDFDKYKNNGHSESEIYQQFIDTCLSYEVIPLYCDVDGKYKLIDLNSFLLIIDSRLKASGKEMTTKFGYLRTSINILPEAVGNELNALRSNTDFDMLKQARDELNKFLPEHRTDEN